MQFVVTAYDYTDDDAITRRLANRDKHLADVKTMIKAGTFLSGGAILDENNKMIGSTVHVQFNSREQLDAWIKNDPYTTGKVWEKIDIKEVKLVPIGY